MMLSGEGNENDKKTNKQTTIGLVSKKLTFFEHFFAAVLHDCQMKLPETS